MEPVKNVSLALFMAVLAFAGFASTFGMDYLWRFASVVAVGVVASVGAVVFFYSALNRR